MQGRKIDHDVIGMSANSRIMELSTWPEIQLLLLRMLVHFMCKLSSRVRGALILQVDLMGDLDILSSVGKTSSLLQDTTSHTARLEKMIDLLKSNICGFRKEEINRRNNYHQIERSE
jgi:hypothetical protein